MRPCYGGKSMKYYKLPKGTICAAYDKSLTELTPLQTLTIPWYFTEEDIEIQGIQTWILTVHDPNWTEACYILIVNVERFEISKEEYDRQLV